ncbi:disease resistance protein RUN1 [Eucalyptus grandis]|uniref:disease resistance protein RUN1 n=1 Tax=Eucalyptus grandis TaxID=71139 RepID=UPI00192E7D48|nr:disease resistance protein RUN1 [Eucalyptus grandis]XP_039166461.1 disease resistance protein RUN1 [Eucalyptus grandis]XP_039166462.1 disease resistance protein RUN1 [Eucalyptus grandis]XP_039166463.1 disease resistance protein RUN1 [Eucalyptus grandis]XP_039166464.1 disease resistance protein RUN1 [Eucalyptus grandis]XP_039166465.1 disease resistance protein RUN1 [Eucalyptus grandis]XP_039166466.1 disease resistance protein RUN1 [Eucalyptus grandis]XP_039166467.1 disease resistance prote
MGGQHEDAKPSASCPSVVGNNYPVYLSISGADAGTGFVHSLYDRLNDVGLRIRPNFRSRDDDDLPSGKEFAEDLISAITHSKVSIPVISKNYVASEWCLRELIHIMERVESGEQKVLPVLYKVEAEDARTLKGAFGEAFQSSMHLFKEDVKQRGKEALKKAVASTIFESEKFARGREGELVKELVEIIMREQQDDFPPSLPMDLVGIDDQVAEVRKLVDTAYPDARIIGIYGTSGIGGLPLVLMVMGSLLKGKEDQRVWKEMLEKLRNVPTTAVQQKLRVSYNTLEHEEQQMFLDIACFLIGTDKRIASYLWDDLKFFPLSGLGKMFTRSLIKYNDDNELRMHDLLRDLGRSIARPADKKPCDCSRLWDKEAMAVLGSEQNEYIEALRMDENGSSKFMEQDSFKRLPKLKFLHVSAVDFAGHSEESLCELRWLKWESCPHSLKATGVHLEKLLVFDLSGGNIHENWEGWGSIKMERLKVLNLSSCSNLKTTPKLSAFKSLEMLILEYCQNLEEIDPSVGDVKCLVSLNLRYCGSLKKLPAQLGQLKELGELLIDETDIKEIPPCIGSLKKLKMLSAVGCGLLTQIPSSISRLVNLSTLNLTTCKTLQELGSFKALGELRRLYLVCCYRLKQLPSSIGELEKLVELDLSHTRIKELPESIEKLKNLKILRISHSEIEKLPSSIGKLESLQKLDASGCHKLEGQILGDIGGLSCLRTLYLGKARISHLPENFGKLSTLNHLDLLYCSELESLPDPPSGLSSLQLTCRSNTLPSLSHLSNLKKLTLHCCMFLESIPELPSNIRKLHVWKCPKLKRLPDLSNLRSLMEIELLQCYELLEFNGLEALESLTKLDVSTSTQLLNLNDFEDLELWTNLDPQSYDGEADNLHELRGISHLKSLEVLNISGRKHIQRLDLSKSEHLKRLIVNNCESLIEIHCHDKIESLEHFDRNGCKSLTIPDFSA